MMRTSGAESCWKIKSDYGPWPFYEWLKSIKELCLTFFNFANPNLGRFNESMLLG